ncbi:MAG: hypothetical protein J6C53_02625 [Clostridia bacterium]|nr:hypothetical protein [Clostridia bacterium]
MEQKPRTKSSKIVNIISNCIFIPVMIILVVYFIYSMSIITKNGVPSFFGQSYVRIMSNSMVPSGFKRGDVVILEKKMVSEIEVGDVIAFYYCVDGCPNTNGTREEALENDFKIGQETFTTTIYFHKVYKITYDSYGDTWFYTYGTNNLKSSNSDPNSVDIEANYKVDKETRGDHVVGVYKESWLAGVIQFISSTQGMIILIIVPSAILLFTLLLNIIEIADQMIREKKQQKALADGELLERELDVTTIIEEHEDEDET